MRKELQQRLAPGRAPALQCLERFPGKDSCQRKQRVLKVACQLFARRGFDGCISGRCANSPASASPWSAIIFGTNMGYMRPLKQALCTGNLARHVKFFSL